MQSWKDLDSYFLKNNPVEPILKPMHTQTN